MFLEERRNHILERLHQEGRVSVKDLSTQLDVSAVTIRADLQALEQRGLLHRTHGGAMIPSPRLPGSERAFEVRRQSQAREKDSIGKAAAALVEEGFGVAMDGSTTALAITPYLKKCQHLVIVTHSLTIAQQFLDLPQFEVYLPAGQLRRDSISLVGRSDTLPEINCHIGFFGTHGITMQAGMGEVNADEAEIKARLIDRCMQVAIVADSTKWGEVAPYTFAPIEKVDTIITNDDAPQSLVEEITAVGTQVIFAR